MVLGDKKSSIYSVEILLKTKRGASTETPLSSSDHNINVYYV